METISLFPKICLSTLDELGINYSVIEEENTFCTLEINEQNCEIVYRIGWQGHLQLLSKGE